MNTGVENTPGHIMKLKLQNILSISACQDLCQLNAECVWIIWKPGDSDKPYEFTLRGMGVEKFTANKTGRNFGPKVCP